MEVGRDLAQYLRYSGATVSMSKDFFHAVREGAEGNWVFVVLPDQHNADVPYRATVDKLIPARRVLLLGRGGRRKPRLNAEGHVSIDLDAMSRARFVDAVALAAGIEDLAPRARDIAGDDSEKFAHSHRPLPVTGRHILVAEDNPTNREVIGRQLQRLGVAATMAVDGREALSFWRGGQYDLVLTDLAMPDMDGFALTNAIRSEEDSNHKTIIVALTANAFPEEEARCISAGMNDYLAKPILLPRLRESLTKWLSRVPVPQESEKRIARPSRVDAPVDLGVLVEAVGGNPQDVEAVLGSFRQSSMVQSRQLREAIHGGEMAAAGAIAHKFKSGARAIGAGQLGKICEEIERAAKANRLEVLAGLGAQFETEIVEVWSFLDSEGIERRLGGGLN